MNLFAALLHRLSRTRTDAHRRLLAFALPILLLPSAAAVAQTPIDTGGSGHAIGRRTYCHDNLTGEGWAVTTAGNGDVLLWHQATTGGAFVRTSTVNDNTSGGPGDTVGRANEAVMTMVGSSLVITWGAFYYPGNYRQWYRALQPQFSNVGPIVNLSTIFGTAQTASLDIATQEVSAGMFRATRVVLLVQSNQGWRNQLVSTFLTFGTPTFGNLGFLSSSASSQYARIAVDASDKVHAVYYRNVGLGQFTHRSFDPYVGTSGAWGGETILASTFHNNYTGDVAATPDGKVHVVYSRWTTATTKRLFYQQLGTAWSTPEDVDARVAQSMDHAFAVGTDKGNRVYVAYPDDTGHFWVSNKTGQGHFEHLYEVRPSGSDATTYPSFSGSLWSTIVGDPRNDATTALTFRKAGTARQTWIQTIDSKFMQTGDGQCNYAGRVSLSGEPRVGKTLNFLFDATAVPTTKFLRIASSPRTGASLCGCNLLVDDMATFAWIGAGPRFGTSLAIPPGVANLTVYFQGIEIMPCGGMSNIGQVTLQ